MDTKLYYYLSNAIDRNIIVYDSDASPHVLTKRLLALMKSCFDKSVKGKIKEIYICEDEYQSLFAEEIDENGARMVELITVYGVPLTKTPFLNKDGDGLKMYKELRCLFPSGDSNLVLMVGEDNKALAGSY